MKQCGLLLPAKIVSARELHSSFRLLLALRWKLLCHPTLQIWLTYSGRIRHGQKQLECNFILNPTLMQSISLNPRLATCGKTRQNRNLTKIDVWHLKFLKHNLSYFSPVFFHYVRFSRYILAEQHRIIFQIHMHCILQMPRQKSLIFI